MKKTIFAAVAALAMLIPASLRAEDAAKEYNMVITLQNGTTITLGHNDIKNITFNGEEIEISGNVADTLKDLEDKSEMTLDRTYMLQNMVEEYYIVLKDHVDQLSSIMEFQINETEDLKDKVNQHEERIDDLQNNMNTLLEIVNEIRNHFGI